RCTNAKADAAGAVALASLLDLDTAVYEFGRAATREHPQRVLDDARRALYGDPQPAVSDPKLTAGNDLPPAGLLQVLAALPRAQARELSLELLGSRETRLRALALAAGAAIDYAYVGGEPATASNSTLELARLREVVVSGKAKDALLAIESLDSNAAVEAAEVAASLDAVRKRADALAKAGIATDDERGLARTLVWSLAAQLQAKDRKRIQALIDAIDTSPEDGKDDEARGLERGLERLLESFDDGRKLLAKRGSPEGQDYGDLWVRHKRSRPAPRSLEQLRDAPLASLAPGREWDYFRVSNIGLFVASIEDLLWRLTPAEAGDAFAVRRLVTNTLVEGPFALLRDSGGLDVGAGVEEGV
ncbi:MAG: hypothetical protein KC431_04355, partial [Myxococcales bacterium]|nr:hypothetical protein [Myxococcales bacterium]